VLAAVPDDVRARFHFFNSFFYKKLSEKGSEPTTRASRLERARRAHDRVKTWTKVRWGGTGGKGHCRRGKMPQTSKTPGHDSSWC
jgi:hypothetical protein